MKAQIYEDKAGEFRWRIIAANGRTLADSGEGYTRRVDARRAVTRLLRAALFAKAQTYEDKAGEFRWRIISANGRTLADSGEGYTRRVDARRAVTRLLRAAFFAEVAVEHV